MSASSMRVRLTCTCGATSAMSAWIRAGQPTLAARVQQLHARDLHVLALRQRQALMPGLPSMACATGLQPAIDETNQYYICMHRLIGRRHRDGSELAQRHAEVTETACKADNSL